MAMRALIFGLLIHVFMWTMPAWGQSSEYEKAIASMMADPQTSFATISQRRDGLGILDQILIRYAFEQQSPERDRVISGMQEALHRAIQEKPDGELIAHAGPLKTFDGTLETLLPTIVMASVSGVAQSHKSFYAIPCAVLQVEPGFVDALEPVFDGIRDATIPRAGCIWGRGRTQGFPIDALSEFIDAGAEVSSPPRDGQADVIQTARAVRKTLALQRAMVAPETLPDPPYGGALPYENWSRVMPMKRVQVGQATDIAEKAQLRLVAYWRAQGRDNETAVNFARRTLFAVTYGADCGNQVPVPAVRVMVLTNQPASQFADLPSNSIKNVANLIFECEGDVLEEPFLHSVVARPDILPSLYVRGYFADVEARDKTGKTALMAAAEQNSLASVRWLIAHGANVEARTIMTGPGEVPKHGEQTALHFAAAFGSLELITTLLSEGADPFSADDEGYRAVDYLTGWAPVGGNKGLSGADYQQAERLLGG